MASPSELIDERIAELDDWRGELLARIRALVKQAVPDVAEEWKWRGTPVWSHGGNICTGETYKDVVKLTLEEDRTLNQQVAITNLDDGTIAIYLNAKVVSDAVKAALQEIVKQKRAQWRIPSSRPARTPAGNSSSTRSTRRLSSSTI